MKNYFTGYAYANVPIRADLGNKKFIGGAAGFVDASRGFGVRYALQSGFLAAKAIIKNENYDVLWKKTFEKELIESLKRRFFLEKLTDEDYEKFIIGKKVNIAEYQKIPKTLFDLWQNIKFTQELNAWQKKFSLEKVL